MTDQNPGNDPIRELANSILEHHWRQLVDDEANGRLSPGESTLELQDEFRRQINAIATRPPLHAELALRDIESSLTARDADPPD